MQRFFLAYATIWAQNATPKSLSLQDQSNEHAVSRDRVIGTFENMPEFAKTFGCARGDAPSGGGRIEAPKPRP